jgi:predicted flap endonuclease-1-like 5' DNA nuclease
MAPIKKIEGIGEKYGTQLKMIGIGTIEALLERGASAKGRDEIAEKSGINAHLILEWVNRADLFRVKGVGEEYSDLLEASGVDTVVELAQRRQKTSLKRWSPSTRRRSWFANCPPWRKFPPGWSRARSYPGS